MIDRRKALYEQKPQCYHYAWNGDHHPTICNTKKNNILHMHMYYNSLPAAAAI